MSLVWCWTERTAARPSLCRKPRGTGGLYKCPKRDGVVEAPPSRVSGRRRLFFNLSEHLQISRLPIRRREGNLPEYGKWFEEFQRNEKAFRAVARSAGDACDGAFTRAFIDDFDFGVGIKRALANHHCAMDIDGDSMGSHFDNFPFLHQFQCNRHHDDDALAAASFFPGQERCPAAQLILAMGAAGHRSSPQNPISGLISSIPNSQPSSPRSLRQPITPALAWLLTRFITE